MHLLNLVPQKGTCVCWAVADLSTAMHLLTLAPSPHPPLPRHFRPCRNAQADTADLAACTSPAVREAVTAPGMCPGTTRCSAGALKQVRCNGRGACSNGGDSDDYMAVPICSCDQGWAGSGCSIPVGKLSWLQQQKSDLLDFAVATLPGLSLSANSATVAMRALRTLAEEPCTVVDATAGVIVESM